MVNIPDKHLNKVNGWDLMKMLILASNPSSDNKPSGL